MQIQYSHHLANGLSLNRQLSLRSQAESTRWPTLGMPFIKEKAMAPAWYNGVLRRHTYHTKYKYCYADRRHVTPKMDKGCVFHCNFCFKIIYQYYQYLDKPQRTYQNYTFSLGNKTDLVPHPLIPTPHTQSRKPQKNVLQNKKFS